MTTRQLGWLLALLVVFTVSVVVHGQMQARPLELYRTRPSCDTAVALDLPSSWKTPTQSGMTVWACK